jgi:hypothetical protein
MLPPISDSERQCPLAQLIDRKALYKLEDDGKILVQIRLAVHKENGLRFLVQTPERSFWAPAESIQVFQSRSGLMS